MDFGHDLLNWLAYTPRDEAIKKLKETLKSAIPEGSETFKDQLADMMARRVYNELSETAMKSQITPALTQTADLIKMEETRRLHEDLRAASNSELTTAATSLSKSPISLANLRDLQEHQRNLAAAEAYIKQLPDDSPPPAPDAPPASDSKTALQGRLDALKSTITGELQRRSAKAEEFSGKLIDLENGDLADAKITDVSGDALRGQGMSLATLRGQINSDLPKELRGTLLDSVGALNGKIEAELQRRTTEIGTALQLLESGDFAAIARADLQQRQAALTALSARINTQLPQDMRAAWQDRVATLNRKIDGELFRREDVAGWSVRELDRLAMGDGDLTADKIKNLGQDALEVYRDTTLPNLDEAIIKGMPAGDSQRAKLQSRVQGLQDSINAELQRRAAAVTGFAGELTKLEQGGLADANINIADGKTLRQHTATLKGLEAQIKAELPEGDTQRTELLGRVTTLNQKIAAEPERRGRVMEEITRDLDGIDRHVVDLTPYPSDGIDALIVSLNTTLVTNRAKELPVELFGPLKERKDALVEKLAAEVKLRADVARDKEIFNRRYGEINSSLTALGKDPARIAPANIAESKYENPLAILRKDINASSLPQADKNKLVANVDALKDRAQKLRVAVQRQASETRGTFGRLF